MRSVSKSLSPGGISSRQCDGLFIVPDGIAPKKLTQAQGIEGMTEPDQGGQKPLVHRFMGQAPSLSKLSQGGERRAIEAVVGYDDLAELSRKPFYQGVERGMNLSNVNRFIEIRGWLRRGRGELIMGGKLRLGHGTPDLTSSSWPGLGREGCDPDRVIAEQCLPEADASGLQGLGVVEIAQPLTAHYKVHQTLVSEQFIPDVCHRSLPILKSRTNQT